MTERMCTLFGEIRRDDVPLAGGKGANLGDMTQAGLCVPPGFVICAPAYRQVVVCCDLGTRIEELLANVDRTSANQLQEVEGQIRALFEEIAITDELTALILERYASLGPDVPVAVRSSATAEDLAGASFAGQQETLLNVRGTEDLLRAVRRCWSSLYTSQAIFYRHQKGFDNTCVSMAVVVQQMIDAEKSGVIFTVDPVLRNPYNMIVEAVWGLGEGIVSGTITPDHYKVDRENYEIIFESIPEKRLMYSRKGDRGVIKQVVPAEKVLARVLSDTELQALVDLGNCVEAHFGSPQDIEWAIEKEQIYLLQSRPITSL